MYVGFFPQANNKKCRVCQVIEDTGVNNGATIQWYPIDDPSAMCRGKDVL